MRWTITLLLMAAVVMSGCKTAASPTQADSTPLAAATPARPGVCVSILKLRVSTHRCSADGESLEPRSAVLRIQNNSDVAVVFKTMDLGYWLLTAPEFVVAGAASACKFEHDPSVWECIPGGELDGVRSLQVEPGATREGEIQIGLGMMITDENGDRVCLSSWPSAISVHCRSSKGVPVYQPGTYTMIDRASVISDKPCLLVIR